MSAVFQSGYSNLGQRALAKAKEQSDKYQQELTKKEMVSQTEESLGGIKLFTSGRELGSKLLKDSKLKPYLKQQAKKAFGKAKGQVKKALEGEDEPPTKPIKMGEVGDVEEEGDEAAEVAVKVVPKQLSNIGTTDRAIARFGRIARARKAAKIENGMSEEDAEADSENYIRAQGERLAAKGRLNSSLQNSADTANEQAQAEAKAATEARAQLKARGQSQAKPKPKGKGKGDGDDDEEDDVEDLGEGATEGTELTGMETLGSVLDAIPGLDIIGSLLGVAGLAAGFAKKPPHEMSVNPNVRSNASYSSQLGVDS